MQDFGQRMAHTIQFMMRAAVLRHVHPEEDILARGRELPVFSLYFTGTIRWAYGVFGNIT